MVPIVAFNTVPATPGNYFNHHDVDSPFLLAEVGKSTIRPGSLSRIYNFYLSHNYHEPITDVRFYAHPSMAETRAEVVSSLSEPYVFPALPETLSFTFDDREIFYSALFPENNLSAAQVCEIINEAVGELVAVVREVDGLNRVVLRSPSRGIGSKIFINPSTWTAAEALGLPFGAEPVAVGTTGNWGRVFGNGAWGKCRGTTPVSYPVVIGSENNGLRLSLNFGPFVEVSLPAGSYASDAELKDALSDGLEDAGFIVGTHLTVEVTNGYILFTSATPGGSSSVRVRPWEGNDVTGLLGLSPAEETRSSYPNASGLEDKNEILAWGNAGYGLEIGDGTDFIRLDTDTGADSETAVPLTWGEEGGGAIRPFIPGSQGEVVLAMRLGVPPDVVKTGFREVALMVEFVYS